MNDKEQIIFIRRRNQKRKETTHTLKVCRISTMYFTKNKKQRTRIENKPKKKNKNRNERRQNTVGQILLNVMKNKKKKRENKMHFFFKLVKSEKTLAKPSKARKEEAADDTQDSRKVQQIVKT